MSLMTALVLFFVGMALWILCTVEVPYNEEDNDEHRSN